MLPKAFSTKEPSLRSVFKTSCPARQNGRGEANALTPFAGAAVAQLDPLHRDRTDPGSTTRSGAWPCRTTRSRPSGNCTPFIRARNASASASMAWASSRRAPLRRTAVSGSSIASGCRRRTTVLFLIMAYRPFGRFRQASTRLDTPPFSHRHHPVPVTAHCQGRSSSSREAGSSAMRASTVDIVELSRGDQGVRRCGSLAAAIGTGEQPGASPQGNFA